MKSNGFRNTTRLIFNLKLLFHAYFVQIMLKICYSLDFPETFLQIKADDKK